MKFFYTLLIASKHLPFHDCRSQHQKFTLNFKSSCKRLRLFKEGKNKAHCPLHQNENQAKGAQMCKVSFCSNCHIVFTLFLYKLQVLESIFLFTSHHTLLKGHGAFLAFECVQTVLTRRNHLKGARKMVHTLLLNTY